MYKRATIAIDDTIRNGKDGHAFQRPAVMAQFALTFSQRYFDAVNAHFDPRGYERPTHLWQWHFQGLRYNQPIVFQHRLTAVDAHINLDLGIAAAHVGRGSMPKLRADFNVVNTILVSQVQAVLTALGDVSPKLQKIRDHIPDAVEVEAINDLLKEFRKLAWGFATTIAEEDEDRTQEMIDLHDSWASGLSTLYLYPPGKVGHCVRWIAKAESRDIAAVISRLDEDSGTPQPLNPRFLA